MKERIEAIILTKKGTIIEGWLAQNDKDSFLVICNRNKYPYLKKLEASEVSDVSIVHNYGDRYLADEDFSNPWFLNS